MRTALPVLILLYSTTLFSCKDPEPVPAHTANKPSVKRVVKLLPIGKTDPTFVRSVHQQLQQYLPGTQLLPPEKMPAHAYFRPRNRYRADSLIHWMRSKAGPNEVIAGITQQDISATKGTNPDSGVMGLGFQPGPACVASSIRLRNKSAFIKILVHELGHTSGLPHCPVKTCFMRDANGGNPTAEETGFCPSCKAFLIKDGWNL